MSVHELDEAASLAGRNLHVGNLAEPLEERSELILGHIARKTSDENRSVVRVGKLVHLRGGVEATASAIRGRERPGPHVLLRNVVHHGRGRMVTGESMGAGATFVSTCNRKHPDGGRRLPMANLPVLGGGCRDPHRTTAAVDSLHFHQGTLLVSLLGEADKSVTPALARYGIRHDLGRLAAGEPSLEKCNENIFVHLRTEISYKDGVFRATVITKRY
jgi:hypothetical protein